MQSNAMVASPTVAEPRGRLDAAPRETAVPRPVRQSGWRSRTRVLPTLLALVLVVAVTVLVTGWNVGGAPHYESDEGTYVGSAWSIFEEGKLSYYTYNYDHPPFGWFLMGVWAKLVGGFTAIGSSITTARQLMVLVAAISSVLILAIVRRATGSLAAGVSAALLFAVSPLATSLHRQVWLDNIATMWLLLSVFFLLDRRSSLKYTLLSGLAFGLGFWTKEVVAVFLPAMLLVVFVCSHPVHRRFAVTAWAAAAIGLMSFFVLLAFLKDELLPPGVLWSSDVPHVSLLDTYAWQMSRAGGGSILSTTGDFRRLFGEWWRIDPLLVLGGLGNALLALVLVRWVPFAGAVAALALTYLVFLARGGVVLFYYVIPILALLALVYGLLQGYAGRVLARVWRPLGTVAGVAFVILGLWRASLAANPSWSNYVSQPTAAQDAAAAWMIATLPRDSTILMDSYAWVEMRDASSTGGRPFENAHYYWPGVSDPSIRSGVLHDNWRNIDYLAVSPSLEADIATRDLPILPDALSNSDEIRTFSSDDWSVRIMRIRKLHNRGASDNPFLLASWDTYKRHYIRAGQVVPTSGATTAESQSYALLRAVYADDRAAFDEIWSWTSAHLQVRPSDALLAWGWRSAAGGTELVFDAGTSTGADQDAAVALLFAARRWSEPGFESEARRIIGDIWQHETSLAGGRRVLAASTSSVGNTSASGLVVNPSHFAPYAYRIFAEVDQAHQWEDLVDSSYDILSRLRGRGDLGGHTGVVPNWLAMNETTGELEPASVLGEQWAEFGHDASRVPWRLALDWLWFRDDRARDALRGISLPYRELTAHNRLAAGYFLDGRPAADYEALSMYAGTLPGLLVGQDRDLALRVFAERIMRAYRFTGTDAYWGDLNDITDQTWGWFATALVEGGMANLWAGERLVSWDEVLP